MRTPRLVVVLVVTGALSMLLVPESEAACKICQENQGGWICVYTPTRIKCMPDGDTCSMQLVSNCGLTPGGCSSPDDMIGQPSLLEGLKGISAGTIWFPMKGDRDPLVFTKITFGKGKRIRGGELLNRGLDSIAGYQLGLIVVKRNGSDSEVVPGPAMESTVPIKPGEVRGMPPQLLEGNFTENQPLVVGVFLLEVRFADGSSWRANVARMQAEAERLANSINRKRSILGSTKNKKHSATKGGA